MERVIDNVFTLKGMVMGRVYLITDSDGLTLIDAAVPPAGKRILNQIKAAGYAPSDLKRILITHAHPDHVGAVPELVKATGAKVYVPEGERAAFEGEIAIPSASTRFTPPETVLKDMKADVVLADGQVLDEVMGGLHAIHTPGHAPGHMVFWQPNLGILFCGDVIFNFRKMGLPWAFLTVDPEENKRSIAKVAQLNAKVVCFGHGKPIHNAAGKISAFAASVGAA